jgi:DNA-binding response OmpR family regulator
MPQQRLLVADDSITIQKVIELTFADEKIEVVAVSDGDQAIARLASERFDIVLADIGMPVKDGFEVARFVKGHPRLAHVPVILLTGAFDPVDETKVSAVGAAAVLAKPFEPQVLVSRVRDLLRNAKAAAPPVNAPSAPDSPGPRLMTSIPAAEAASSSVDEYFERLDRAFANLNVPLEPRELVRPFPRPVPAPEPDDEQPEAVTEGSDEPAAALPAPSSESTVEATIGGAEAVGEAALPGGGELPGEAELPDKNEAGVAEATPPQLQETPSTLASRFATMLAVEQGELPATALDAQPHNRIDDALVDRIVRRVVEQMSDRAVRDLAAEIVSRTAERLVREEIERIKSGA